MLRVDPASPAAAALDDATWSVDDTGSHAVDRELQRELVRAALFDGAAPPRIGRFAVGERLGAGASSVVYAAYDEHLARRVAVKVFVAASAAHDHVQREARALARLSHRNVVAVFEVGEWRGRAFIAMELIAGATLARWQATQRSTAALLDAYRQAALGLAAAHRAGLVHRDFKPANVMVADDGRVVVTDFGLAGAHGEVTGRAGGTGTASTAPVIGTPAYVAPEQRRGAVPHPSADIYSFAVALCEALIGRHPMQPGAISWERALAQRVPRRLCDAICAGLAHDPAARGDTMAGLLAALNPPARGRRRGVAIAAAGLAASALAVASRSGGPAPPEPLPQRVFQAPSHRAVIRQIDDLLAAPPRSDDRAAALRGLVLAPVPSELRCDWPAPLVALSLAADHAIGLDDRGRIHACALDGGAVATIARDARCAVAGPDGAIGVVDTAARAHVLRAGSAGWRPVAVAQPPGAIPPTSWSACPITVVADGGTLRVLVGNVAIAADGSGDTEIAELGGEVRIRRRSGATLASLALPASGLRPELDISRDGALALAVLLHGPLRWWKAGRWHEETVPFDAPSLIRARLSPSGARALLVNQFGGLEVRTLGGGTRAWLTSDAVTDAVFRGDDAVVASDAEHRLWRWDLAAQRTGVVTLHRGAVWSVASNAEIVASGGEDGTATVIDRGTGAARLALDFGAEIYRTRLDGDHLLVAGNDGLQRWDWRLGAAAPLAEARGLRIWDVAPATVDGARIYLGGALGYGAIYRWTAERVTELRRASTPSARVSAIAISGDGRTAAAVDSHGRLVVLDIAAPRIALEVTAHRAWARRVAFDPTTATIVTTGDDGYLRTWSTAQTTPRVAVEIGANRSPVYGLDVHRGRAVTASYDGGVALVDLASGQIVQRYRGHTSALRIVRFRSDGRWFVTGDSDGRVCLWRVDSADCHTWLDGHRSSVLAAEFADDGTILTASSDGVVRWWRPSYDQPVAALLDELARRRARQ